MAEPWTPQDLRTLGAFLAEHDERRAMGYRDAGEPHEVLAWKLSEAGFMPPSAHAERDRYYATGLASSRCRRPGEQR